MRTALYDRHKALSGKMVEFCGWEMPIQYRGIIHEHQAVRDNVGIFDVSHMGRILVEGKDAERFLDYASTNRIEGKHDLSATYTVLCNPTGGSVDDVLIYKENPQRYFLIVNAGNRMKDLEHLQQQSKDFDVVIKDLFNAEGILAIQGPKAAAFLTPYFPDIKTLRKMHFCSTVHQGQDIILSRTGYTGEDGFEIYAPNKAIVQLWDILLKDGIEPIGLGARDTLRLEMGFALYGHELNDTISPTESVSAWTVKWDRPFLGKEPLLRLEESPAKRSEHGIKLIDKGIAREGYEVFKDGNSIGKVTSGTHSPSLNTAIAIVLVKGRLQEGNLVDVMIRNNPAKAEVVNMPFYQNQEKL